MNRYLIRRVFTAIPTLLAISFVIFAVLSLAPNDPLAQFGANPSITAEIRENIRRSLGLDQPWPIRYVKWIWTLVTTGDFGRSFTSRLPVMQYIGLRLPSTLLVLGTAYLISILLAIPIGIISAVKQYSILDHLVSAFAFIGFSVPTFFTGVLLILIFSVKLHWLPFIFDSTIQVNDLGSLEKMLKQSAMPITVLALINMATLARYIRASMLETLPLDYVRTAHAKGLRERWVIWRHAFRNSLLPVVTLLALGIPNVFGGALITEQIFRVPGIGSLLVTSLETGDTPVIMGINLIFAILVVGFNLIADVLYAFIDPRIQME